MSAFDRMRKGDRGALRELLFAHGARMDAALAALDAASDDAWRAAVKAAWAESAVSFGEHGDDGAHLLACALASAAVPLLERSQLDARVAASLAARVAAGIASDDDRELHEHQSAEEPLLADIVARMKKGAASTASGAGRAERLWPSVERELK